ncbi:hypothetical protein [Agromyces mariniharenae]|uniref:Uncharacterized protein n=1 Tax=Agromyces mariniharenae TaxID=2604423 RepID=A0A5S4UX25_9MICO|nr:hypothetical protein [Agromyces mariniharenae]TYL51126.1 hypothetical protein FYC51_18570 [Agromyces mariniharenae]
MSDARPGEPFEGEYTDSELPLSAELPKDEYDEVEEVVDADRDGRDDDEVEVVEIVEIDDGTTYPER